MSEASEQAADVRALNEALRETSVVLEKASSSTDAMRLAQEASGKAVEKNEKALGKLKELSIEAFGGGEAAEKYRKMREAMAIAGDATMSTGKRMQAFGVAAKFATGTVVALASQALELAGDYQRINAETYLYNQRVAALGASLQSMRQATSGAVETQVAFNLQQALAEKGLIATDRQMAVLARRVREYAQERQVSQSEASAVVQRALDGDVQAANSLGVSLANATTATQRHAAVLSQLEARQRGAAVATRDAAEQARINEQAQARSGAAIQKFVTEALGGPLIAAYDGAVRALASFNTYLDENRTLTAQEIEVRNRANAALAETARRTREQQALQDLAAATARRSAQAQQNAADQQLRDLNLLSTSKTANTTAETQLADAIRRRGEAARLAGETEDAFAQRRLALTQEVITAEQRLTAERDRQAQVGKEQTRIANEERESARQAAQQASQALRQQTADKQRQMDVEQEFHRLNIELMREGAMDRETVSVLERRRFETIAEFRAREVQAAREALEAIHAQRQAEAQAFEAFLEQQRQRLQLERENAQAKEAAAQAERNRAKEQAGQDELAARLRGAFGLAESEVETANQRLASAAKIGADTIGELFSGSLQAAVDAAKGGEDAAAAVAKYVDEWTAGKAVQWGLQALEAVAGAGVAYFIRPDAVPGLLASAATYAGLAATAGAVTAAIPNAPAAGAGGPTEGGAGGERMAGSTRSATAAETGPVAPIVFNVSGFTSTESAQEGIVRALREAQARGLIEMGR